MTVDANKISEFGDELYSALLNCSVVEPLTDREPEISTVDAYRVSAHILERRIADGETVIGKKIGVTSEAVQRMLDVNQPDFGYLTDRMLVNDGDQIPITAKMIQPRAEGEIAFVMKYDLIGPGVGPSDVMRATDFVAPCFEIVDSRIRDWRIKIQDTIADNASCGYFVLGNAVADPRSLDLSTCGLVLEQNGVVAACGAGAATLGSPLVAVAWLANTLGAFGISLKAGDIILSGSLVPLMPIEAGDHMTVSIGGIGSTRVRFV